jgi:hypothetical protein
MHRRNGKWKNWRSVGRYCIPERKSQELFCAGGSGSASQGLPDMVSNAFPHRGAVAAISSAVRQDTRM